MFGNLNQRFAKDKLQNNSKVQSSRKLVPNLIAVEQLKGSFAWEHTKSSFMDAYPYYLYEVCCKTPSNYA